MATGDLTSPSISADGKQVTISAEGLNGALITQIETGKTVILNCTSEGYTGSTLGTTARSMLCSFVSASGASPASIILAPIEPIYDDDVSITFDADVAAFDDGTNTSTVASGVSASGAVTLDYPLTNARIAGVINSSNELGVQYSVLTGTISAEALGFGHHSNGQPMSAIKFELDDGATTLTSTITVMSRSDYDPSIFYDACVAGNLVSVDPYATNSGGSGVFAASFDTTSLVDGDATLTITAYPVIGDAASIRTEAWSMYIDNSASLTQTTVYCDSRGSVSHSGITGTFTANERVDAGASGAILRFRYEAAGVLYFSAMNNIALQNPELLTGVTSGATANTSSLGTYNGSSSGAGTSGDPKRTLSGSVPTGATGVKYNIYLMGDTSYPSDYALGRSTTGAVISTWMTIQPDSGLTKLDVRIDGAEGAAQNDSRDKRIHLLDLAIWEGVKGDTTRDTALWVDNCKMETLGGRVLSSATWDFPEYYDIGGSYYTRCVFVNRDQAGIDQANFARDCSIQTVNEDGIRSCDVAMEMIVDDNDSPDVSAHQDGWQIDSTINDNRIVYNIVFINIVTTQICLFDNIVGTSAVNLLGLSLGANGVEYSQIGNSSAIHVVTDNVFAHLTFASGALGHRTFAGSTDEKNFIRYSVLQDFVDGYDLSHQNLHNHLLDSSDTGINITSAILDNPWTNGVNSDTDDNEATRDYTPSSATLKNRIPAGERYIAFDLFGTDVPDDGTGAIGALQVVTALTPTETAFLKNILSNVTQPLLNNVLN